jgi:hypothetical protein
VVRREGAGESARAVLRVLITRGHGPNLRILARLFVQASWAASDLTLNGRRGGTVFLQRYGTRRIRPSAWA